jgi:general secretion pathway protein D
MVKQKSWIVCLIFIVTTVMLGMSASGGAQQEQRPLTPEERKKLMEKLLEEAQKGAAAKEQPARQMQTPAQPATPPAPIPAVVERAPSTGGPIKLTYDGADLYEFINQIADTLGISPVIIDPDVKGSVTIHSPLPMSRGDLFPLFNIILKNNNAALVKQGEIYQVVPISAALKKGLEIIEDLPPAPPPPPQTQKETPQEPGAPGAIPPKTDGAPGAAPPAKETAGRQPPPPQVPTPPPTPPAPPPAQPQAPAPQPVQPAASLQAAPAGPPRLATHVIRVELVPVRDLIEPLKLFMTDGGVIMPYDRLNMLIITDYSDSIQKILEMIHLLDTSYLDPDLLELVQIKYNASADVLADLQKVFGSGGKDGGATGVFMVSLDRINAILVMANSKRALAEVKRWIGRLDATTGRSVQTFVYTVKNSTAANIAMILSLLLGGEGVGTGGAGGTGYGGGAMTTTGAMGAGRGGTAQMTGGLGGTATPFGTVGGGTTSLTGGAYGQQGYGGYGQGYGAYGGGAYGGQFAGGVFGGQQLGPRLNQTPGVSAQILKGGVFSGLQDVVRLVADDINNALIIQASPTDYQYILEIIEKMDVLPRQVIIDARIFEIDLTDSLSFGVTASLQPRTGDPRVTTASIDATGALSVGTFAFIGSQRELLMALNALRAKTKVRVLESPAVLALDGTQAKIVVGGEYPYTTGGFVPAAGQGGVVNSIQYRETGIALLIMPRISASGTVTLDVAHEISAPGNPVGGNPTFNKTSVQTTLAVQDGETVAIAGLIRENESHGRTGVPFLSEIPLLGALFGQTNNSKVRTELLIMLTPHVIRTSERLQEMTQQLKDSLKNVRKYVDAQERELLMTREEARQERIKEMERETKRQETPKPETPKPEPAKPESPKPEPPKPNGRN